MCIKRLDLPCTRCGTNRAPNHHLCIPCIEEIGAEPCAGGCGKMIDARWRWRMCEPCAQPFICCEACGWRRPSSTGRVCRPCVRDRQRATYGDQGRTTLTERKAVYLDQTCVYCGYPAENADHVWALERGGPDTVTNLVPACRPCNSSKSTALLSDWAGWRAGPNVMRAALLSEVVAAELVRLNYKSRRKPSPERIAPPTQRCTYSSPAALEALRNHRIPRGPGCLQRWAILIRWNEPGGWPTTERESSMCERHAAAWLKKPRGTVLQTARIDPTSSTCTMRLLEEA